VPLYQFANLSKQGICRKLARAIWWFLGEDFARTAVRLSVPRAKTVAETWVGKEDDYHAIVTTKSQQQGEQI